MNYSALIHKDKTSAYGVSFPDFPGCVSAGRTLEEAQIMAQEALTTHRELLKEMGEPVPLPTSLDEIMADKNNHDAIAVLVHVPCSAFLAEAAMKFKNETESRIS